VSREDQDPSQTHRPPARFRYEARNKSWIPPFLEVLANRGNVRRACEAVGIDRTTAYDRADIDPVFAAQWAEALEQYGDLLEDEARRRAIEGVPEPVIWKGQLVMVSRRLADGSEILVPLYVNRYSDRLLEILLKGHKRAKYGDHVVVFTEDAMDAELRKLEAEHEHLAARAENREAPAVEGASEGERAP
jgi:hypothetical protein